MNARGALLAAALLGSAWLALSGDKPASPDIAQPTRPAGAQRDAATSRMESPNGRDDEPILALLPRAGLSPASSASTAMFGQRSWAPPPPPPPAAVAVRPTAPPVPYQYVGKKWHDGQWTVFLARDSGTFLVKTGDVLEDTYRVQSIDTARLILSYLPLKQEQAIAID